MDSWLNMMLLCGLLLIASLQTTNAFRFRRSKSEKSHLESNVHSLLEHYKTRGTEWLSKSVFATHLDKLNSKSCTCQALLLERMLNIYEELFQDMMSEQKEDRSDLRHVMNEVKILRQKYTEEHNVWKELKEMNSVKVKNGTIRGGALNDFLMVFERAYTEKHKKF